MQPSAAVLSEVYWNVGTEYCVFVLVHRKSRSSVDLLCRDVDMIQSNTVIQHCDSHEIKY